MKNKKRLIIVIIIIAIIAIGIGALIVAMPQIQLNKAINYLKNGEYKTAYSYINSKNNEENKVIVKELITTIFCDRARSGIEKVGNIAKESTDVVKKIDRKNIDYTLDDSININVEALEDYILLEDEISQDMISSELQETYTTYFKILKYVKENFYNVLEHINDNNFINEVNNLSTDMNKIANACFSYSDNHKFKAKTQDVYKEIKSYIVK